jgi:hypothetical protein
VPGKPKGALGKLTVRQACPALEAGGVARRDKEIEHAI